jgi:hypothetical protein
MKTMLLMIIAIILFSCDKNEIEIPLRIKDGANKGIKVLTESRYSAINMNGEVVKGDLLSKSVKRYNEDGNILEYLSYGNNGFQKDNQISLLDNLTYKYDERGYLIEMNSQIDHIMAPSNWVYKNDRYGYEIEMNAYFKDGSLSYKSTSKYDAKGNMVEQNWIEGKETSKQICTYDSENNLIERNEYYNGSEISSLQTTYKYDSKGNVTEFLAVNAAVHFYTRETYEYDAKGNKIVNTSYDTSGKASAILNYKYLNLDSAGNWGRQDCYLNDVIDWITEREIVYY